MFPNSLTYFKIKRMEQQALVASMTERSRYLMTQLPAHRSDTVVGIVRQHLGATFSRIAALGSGSHDCLRIKMQKLAACGNSRAKAPADDRALASDLQTASQQRESQSQHCPTLELIDRALNGARPKFADAVNAVQLERRACELTDQYWSESVWFTGHVPSASFHLVCEALECERLSVGKTAAPPVTPELAAENVIPAAA
jgi:hypothetical protein